MRTANKVVLTACILTSAFAAAPGYADPVPASAPTVVAAIPAPPAAPAMPGALPSNSDVIDKAVASMDDKAIENGRDALHHLNGGTDQVSFEELNSARQTVARIDAMIEIEKHLGELQKLRNERNGGGSSSSFANAIPASALTPPPKMLAMPPVTMPGMQPGGMMMPPATGFGHEEVTRISGSDGKYSAVLKLSDGTTRHVRPGDEISHDQHVTWISSSAVGIEEGGKSRTLHVKNVEMVYSTVR